MQVPALLGVQESGVSTRRDGMRSSLWDGMGRDFFKSGMEWYGMRFLCSGMGWDWDPTGMMKRIFSPTICGIIHLTSLFVSQKDFFLYLKRSFVSNLS